MTPPRIVELSTHRKFWAIALAVMLFSAPAWPEDGGIEFHIPRQSLASALQDFARQAKVQIIYDAELVKNFTAPAVDGEKPPGEALAALLKGASFSIRWANDRTVTITRSALAAEEDDRLSQTTAVAPRPPEPGERSGRRGGAGPMAPNVQDHPKASLAANSIRPGWDQAEDVGTEIVVTGSRIARLGTVTPTPVSVLNTEAIEMTGAVNLVDIVNELPAIGPGVSNANTNFTFTSAGLNILNLRNLGTERTLVLVDGRRHVGSLPGTSAVDISSIPVSLVERVEVITGGASAVYGADAVSGVINFVMKHDFEGVELNVQKGFAEGTGGDDYSISATIGHNLDNGRGNLMFNLSASDTNGVAAPDRGFARAGLEFVPNPLDTGPQDGIPDFVSMAGVRNVEASVSGVVRLPVNPATRQRDDGFETLFTFGPDGVLRPFDFGDGLVSDNRHIGAGDGDIVSLRDSLTVSLRRYLISGSGSYEIAPGHRLSLDGKFTESRSQSRFQPVFDFESFTTTDGLGIILSSDNPFIQDDLRALLKGDPATPDDDIDSIIVSRTNLEFGDRGQNVNRRTLRLVAGLDGELGRDWTYEAYYQYGRSTATITKVNDRLQSRFLQSLDAVLDEKTGMIVCRDPSDGCAPFNPLGPPGTASDDAVAFSRVNTLFHDVLGQHVANIVFKGPFLDLPAGVAELVVGAEYRKETSDSRPPDVSQRGLGFFRARLSPVAGAYHVAEGFVETRVPLLRDRAFAHEVNFEAALRFADYSISGGSASWRVGGDWALNDDIRFRAVLSRAVRAPNIGELFQPGSEGFPRLDDPCAVNFIDNHPNRAANCAALGVPENFVPNNREAGQRTVSVGNPNLDVESATTLTVGIVITPLAIPGLSLTVDYWDIEIDNAISAFPAQSILSNCVDAPSIANQFCAAISRNAMGDVQSITTSNINVSSINTSGVDFEAGYLWNLDAIGLLGTLHLGIIGTYLDRLDFFLPPDIVDRQAGEIGIPRWRFRANANYQTDHLSFNWQLRYIGNAVRDIQEARELRSPRKIGAKWYSDIQARYRIHDNLSFYVGVNNLFGNIPPVHPDTFQGGTSLTPNAIIYDNIGRFFYTGLTVRFMGPR